MNTLDLIHEMTTWGHQVKTEQIPSFHRYMTEMLKRDRVLMLESDRGLESVIFYFLTDDVTPFTNKPTWAMPEDNNGHILFIDKMLSRSWTKSVREAIREQVEARYPQVTEAHWLRRPKNRHVILKRRALVNGI